MSTKEGPLFDAARAPGGEVDYMAWVGEFIEEVAAEHVCDELRAEWDATNSGLIKGRKE